MMEVLLTKVLWSTVDCIGEIVVIAAPSNLAILEVNVVFSIRTSPCCAINTAPPLVDVLFSNVEPRISAEPLIANAPPRSLSKPVSGCVIFVVK